MIFGNIHMYFDWKAYAGSRSSWEPFEQEASVRPVLLFEKSAFGDVFNLSNSESGKQVSLRDTLGICTDVAVAVQDLNKCRVIHGDIKPQNILVFKSSAGQLSAKITDFGYSNKSAIDTRVKMPKSPDWHAPEHHFNWISRAAAMKMDLYSFGLFRFWFALGADRGPFSTQTIASTRDSGRALIIALNAIEAKPHWSSEEKLKSKDLALATLHYEPSLRCSNFDAVVDILGPIVKIGQDTPRLIQLSEFEVRTGLEFDITKSIFQIFMVDARLRRSLPVLLKERLQNNLDSRREAAYQLALCHAIGLGVTRDTRLAEEYLQNAPLHVQRLRQDLDYIICKQTEPSYKKGKFKELFDEGMINTFDSSPRPRDIEELRRIESIYREEIPDLEATFGEENALVLELKLRLALVVLDQGQFKDARDIGEKILHDRKRVLTEHHTDLMRTKLFIASILHEQAEYSNAKAINHEVYNDCLQLFGEEDPRTLNACIREARSAHVMGNSAVAASMYSRILDIRERTMGEEHPETLDVMHALGRIWMHQGKYEDAEIILRRAFEGRQASLGNIHPDTFGSQGDLAAVLRDQDKHNESAKIQREVFEGFEAVLGPRHPLTLSSKGNLSVVVAKMGDFKTAEILERATVEDNKVIKGHDHPDTITGQHNLGCLILAQGRYDEVEEIFRLSITGYEKALGAEHTHTITATSLLATVLKELGKFEESSALYQRAYDGYVSVLGRNHDKTVDCQKHFLDCLERMKRRE